MLVDFNTVISFHEKFGRFPAKKNLMMGFLVGIIKMSLCIVTLMASIIDGPNGGMMMLTFLFDFTEPFVIRIY